MANQTGKNITIAYKVEATLNTAPGASSAKELRLTPSPGLSLQKAAIRSNEIRPDMLTLPPRHGSKSVSGSYSGELSVSSFDEIFEAIVRSTLTVTLAITEATASLASISFGTNTITATNTSTGSGFLQAGIMVGDVFRVSGTGGANDSLNAQVQAVTTHTITVQASAFTADASAVTAFTLTRGLKLTNATTPVRRSFYIDQYYTDIDLSEVFGGCRFGGMTINGTPDGMAEISVNVLGMSGTALATGTSPYYSAATAYTTDPLTFADAMIQYNGSTIARATAFSLTYDLSPSTLPVIGGDTTPDVFDNEARLSGSISILREDLTNLTTFIDETEVELMILLQEAGTAPVGYIGLFVPRLKIMSLQPDLGGDSGMIEVLGWEAGLKTSASGYDQTMISLTTDT